MTANAWEWLWIVGWVVGWVGGDEETEVVARRERDTMSFVAHSAFRISHEGITTKSPSATSHCCMPVVLQPRIEGMKKTESQRPGRAGLPPIFVEALYTHTHTVTVLVAEFVFWDMGYGQKSGQCGCGCSGVIASPTQTPHWLSLSRVPVVHVARLFASSYTSAIGRRAICS